MAGEDFDELATEIRVRRECGQVWIKRLALGRSTTEQAEARADAFVTSLGLAPISWHDMSRNGAHAGAASILHRDLAYDVEIMPATDALRLSKDFFGYFEEQDDDDGQQCRYFTNGTLIEPSRRNGRSWSGITSATFDCGVIVVAKDSIGILWVSDED